MTTLQVPNQSGMTLEDFTGILTAYQQATENLKESHDLLMEEVARLREELRSKNEQLERRKRLAALGEMAAGVAHEIRNPLGSIQLNIDLLGRNLGPGSRESALAEKIGHAVRGLDAIVGDMLTFTRVIEVQREPNQLGDLLAEAAAEIAPTLEQAGAEVDAEGINTSVVLDLDGRLFKRVLINLMLNAADAMREASVPRRQIRFAATGDGDVRPTWRITVSDTGPGSSAEVIDRLFNPFFTTKETGTGLGLAIVHHIVEAHGGTIAAANAPEGGATFTITLPPMPTDDGVTDGSDLCH
jgi:signal transduction histidine kinase